MQLGRYKLSIKPLGCFVDVLLTKSSGCGFPQVLVRVEGLGCQSALQFFELPIEAEVDEISDRCFFEIAAKVLEIGV